MTSRTAKPRARDLQPRWYERIRQSIVDRRRGGRLPRTVRRIIAAGLVVAAGVIALTPPRASGGQPVVALTRDLPIGARLEAQDLQILRADQIPDGALQDPALAQGQVLAGQARRGEVLTDARLADPVGPSPGPGRAAVPVRPADPAIVDLLGPGMHVAVILVGEGGEATVLAADAIVLAIPPAPERGNSDRPVVLSVPTDSADRIVGAGLAGTIALRFT
jgi:pilus assembly protein CpaB